MRYYTMSILSSWQKAVHLRFENSDPLSEHVLVPSHGQGNDDCGNNAAEDS
jgi:hypothetical protein